MNDTDRPDEDQPDPPEPEKERLLRLAGDILDGASVDWTAKADAESPYSEELRAIEALAQLTQRPVLSQWGALKVLDQVGAGAFGEVFRAWDTRLDREVALKLLHPAHAPLDPQTTVIAEGRLLARVTHPNVVTVFGAETIDGRVGIWTEFVHGETLAAAVARGGALPVQEAVAVGLDLCRALEAIHHAGVVHGDVKAQNVLREPGGRIVLVDLGTGHEHLKDIAAASRPQISGTPLYMAPELWRLEGPTPRSDVYSLGVLLYFLVTGTYPVRGATSHEVREAHTAGRRVPLGNARPDLPAAFVATVERALSADPWARFESAAAFRAALERVDPAAARRRRRKATAWVAASVVVAGIALLAWIVARSFGANRAGAVPLPIQLTFNPPERRIVAAAISPDGTSLAYADSTGLHVQPIETRESRTVPLPPEIVDIVDLGWLADSKSLIVATNGGLWRATPGSGAATRISEAGGLMAVSPDGRCIAVRRAQPAPNILIMTTSGDDQRAVVPAEPGVRVSRPTWSRDGGRIAYFKDWSDPGGRHWIIATRRRDGGPETTVLNVTSILSVVWTPDGRILFSHVQQGGGRYADLAGIAVNATTGESAGTRVEILSGRNLNFWDPSVSRDGARLIFSFRLPRSQVYVAEFDPGQLTMQEPSRRSFTSSWEEPDGWVPSSDRVVFRAEDNGHVLFYQQPIDRQEPRLLDPSIGQVWAAAITADGRWIVYSQTHSTLRVPVSGGPTEKLFDRDVVSPQLRCSRSSPTRCVVSSRPRAGTAEIFSFDPAAPAGGPPKQHPALSADVWDLSPDGAEVVGLDTTQPGRLLILNLLTDKITPLPVKGLSEALSVAWAGNAEGWIVTRGVGNDGSQVLHVDRAGRPRVLWESPTIQLHWATVSPDGRHIAFARWFNESNVWMLTRF